MGAGSFPAFAIPFVLLAPPPPSRSLSGTYRVRRCLHTVWDPVLHNSRSGSSAYFSLIRRLAASGRYRNLSASTPRSNGGCFVVDIVPLLDIQVVIH